jgi:hypothetical protein
LTYAEFKNRDYPAVIATARRVHARKHQNAAVVHLFAAGAREAQHDLNEALGEMETLLSEDPKSPLAGQFRQILDQIKTEQVSLAKVKRHPAAPPPSVSSALPPPSAEVVSPQIQQASGGSGPSNPTSYPANYPIPSRRSRELFAATDHGKSVTNLSLSDVEIRDDNQPPQTILIPQCDSASLAYRTHHRYEQLDSRAVCIRTGRCQQFLKRWSRQERPSGLASIIPCFSDFTPDQTLQLAQLHSAPGGGTALWDAVARAQAGPSRSTTRCPGSRLAMHNSSSASLQMPSAAQRGRSRSIQ